jgi:osmotically-inducible protein OsmY
MMRRVGRLFTRAACVAVGVVTMYLLDPDRGRSRRARLRDQAVARARRLERRISRRVRYGEGVFRGRAHRLVHPQSHLPADDTALVQKVRSEALGAEPFSRWPINVDAVDGRVTLRGEVPTPSDAAALERGVRRVFGVLDVENLLHTPGTPAPNKRDALIVR